MLLSDEVLLHHDSQGHTREDVLEKQSTKM